MVAGPSVSATYRVTRLRPCATSARRPHTRALGKREPLSSPLSVIVEVFLRQPASVPKWDRLMARPTKWPDLDNYAKTALTGCSSLWTDDAQVVGPLASTCHAVLGSPRWEIEVATHG